ncbi:MAG TPA: DUF309 domain-containing protein [Methylomirabilota bacterium]|nr:DUF309 domain-containing protein [Methylomirabilota bacterium]
MIATAPLPLRNRLAETIIRALRDPAARRELVALAEQGAAHAGWLADDEARWAPLLDARARAAAAALSEHPLAGGDDDLREALAAAAALFDAGLYFEVHEVLEPYWVRARDDARETLQGIIQAAVGWQHLANGNVAGARSLLEEGAARLHGRRLAGTDFDALARAAAEAAAGLPAVADAPRFPRG